MKKNLVLTGMMGVGKSTIRKALSNTLNMNFFDTDQIIEKEENALIKDIFMNKGEEYFRKVEKKISIEKINEKNSIIALGGGAFVNKDIRESVLKNAISFWLNVDLKILLKRLSGVKKRPLLNEGNLEEKMYEIYEKRKYTYSLANFKIDCNENNIPMIVNKICKIYEDK